MLETTWGFKSPLAHQNNTTKAPGKPGAFFRSCPSKMSRYDRDMERSRPVVVFDLGEVLASPDNLEAQLADRAGTNEKAMNGAYWHNRLPHDEGLSADEYWTIVLADVGVEHSDRLVRDLVALDTAAWMTIRPDAAELLAQLHAVGTRVAILSNMPAELAAQARHTAWAPYVDDWFFSGEMGVAKPAPEIYSRAAVSLAVDPAMIVFIDDRQVNVTAAIAAGWDAHLWTSDAATRALLSGLRFI